MDPENEALRFILGWALVILAAAAFGVLVALGASCAAVTSRADTIARFAQCVEPVIQDEIKRREAEQAANAEQAQKQVDSAKRDAGSM
jgi:hypothetical protein